MSNTKELLEKYQKRLDELEYTLDNIRTNEMYNPRLTQMRTERFQLKQKIKKLKT